MTTKNSPAPDVVALKARLRELQAETSGVVQRLRETSDLELPGAHLVLEAGAKLALLSAESVEEVVHVVALQPVVGMSAAVAGAFTYRGRSVIALELGAVLERRPARRSQLDAHLVVLGTAQPLALLVDHVKAVVTGVTLVADERGEGTDADPPLAERRSTQLSRLVARVGEQVMPVLDAGQLALWVEGSNG